MTDKQYKRHLQKKEILKLRQRGHKIIEAAKIAGVKVTQVYGWIATDKYFGDEMRKVVGK